jgi:SNF2 family DNA or RNA helicase
MPYPASKTTPWDHQKKFWRLAHPHPGFYAAHEMGTGKTKSAIDTTTGHQAQTSLVLCPKSAIVVWPEQFKIHAGRDYRIIAPIKGRIVEKAKHIKNELELAEHYGQPAVVILNYEAFWRPPLGHHYKKNRIVKLGLLPSRNWDMIIADEIHRIKSPGGRASWAATRIAHKAKRRIGLSGTPMPNGPHDIYAQMRFLDSSIFGTNFTVFRSRYCIMGGYENRQIVAYTNMDDLHQRFYSRAHRVTKEEVLDLPPTMHQRVVCQLSTKTMKLYKQVEKDFYAQLTENNMMVGEITINNALVKILRLEQMAGGFVQYDAAERNIGQEIDNAKIDAVQDIAEDLGIDEPLVVVCRFRNEINRTKAMLASLGRKPGELSGQRNDYLEFRSGKLDSIVVQIQAGATAIDLTRARYCVYMSTGHNLGDYLQSLARTHRPGQTKKVTYYHIVAAGTIDEKIISSRMAKKKVIDLVLESRGIAYPKTA